MKIVVISEQTRQRMLSEDPLLGDLDNQLKDIEKKKKDCLLYTSPSPRDRTRSRMPSSA